jgi:hypothetical protein
VCGSTVSGLKKYIKHVGRHLEQLALFALPSLEEQIPAGDAASDEQISAQSSLGVSSQSSLQAGSFILEGERMPLQGEEKEGEEKEEEKENASSTGDNNSIQGASLFQARAEKRPTTLGSTSENSKDIISPAVMQNISMTKEDKSKVIDGRLAWFRHQVASVVASNMELEKLIEMEAGRLKGDLVEGPSCKGIIQLYEQMVQVARRQVGELKSVPGLRDLSELSLEESRQLLATIRDDWIKLKTTLEKVELSFGNLKAKGMDQTGVSHAEDAGEVSARLADLEGEVSDSSKSSAYIQPIMSMAAMRQREMEMGLREGLAMLKLGNARMKEEDARMEAIVKREKEDATEQTETPLLTPEYEAEVGPKQPVANATKNLNLEDDKTIAQMREEKSDSPSKIPFTEYSEQDRHSRSDSKEEPPIKFKDAVGRKFSFPFHLVRTWTVRTQRRTKLIPKTDMISGYA